ncbi:hypothetical protein P9112_012071 [Eukaryota sp. TZLM1-RC]
MGRPVAHVVIFIIVVLGVILMSSFYTVEPAHVALVLNGWTGKVREVPLVSGRYFLGPGFSFYKYPTTEITEDFTKEENNPLDLRSYDGLEVTMEVELQYRLAIEDINYIFDRFITEYRPVIRCLIRSICRDVASNYTAIQFFSERSIVQNHMEDTLRDKLQAISTRVTAFQLHDIDLPSVFEDAISNRQAAERDIDVARSQRDNRLTEKDTELDQTIRAADVRVRNARALADSYIINANATAEGAKTIRFARVEAVNLIKEDIGIQGSNLVRYVANDLLKGHRGKKLAFRLDAD